MAEHDAALAALQMAIQTEIDGYSFYEKFAAQTGDPDARNMFERLARDEVTHLELLRNVKAMLEESGEWAEYKGSLSSPVKGAPIFSRERVAQNVVAYTSDLSALRVAYPTKLVHRFSETQIKKNFLLCASVPWWLNRHINRIKLLYRQRLVDRPQTRLLAELVDQVQAVLQYFARIAVPFGLHLGYPLLPDRFTGNFNPPVNFPSWRGIFNHFVASSRYNTFHLVAGSIKDPATIPYRLPLTADSPNRLLDIRGKTVPGFPIH